MGKSSWKVWSALALQMFAGSAYAGHLYGVVSVDWEGRDLSSRNLSAMKQFRSEFPEIKLLHFLNAAYYTKEGASSQDVNQKVSSVIRKGDELGLHIHAWKSLFEAAGVSFRSNPTYWGTRLTGCDSDCGHEVALTAYTTDEIRKVVRFSTQILSQNGFGRAKSFRTGGWLGSQAVLDAIAAEGFTLDSSRVPPQFLRAQLGSLPIFQWIQDLWGDARSTDQPRSVSTASGPIIELPDNGALADYMSASQMVSVYKTYASLVQAHPDVDYYFQIGFHQETAATYLPQVRQALRTIESLAAQDHVPLTWAELPMRF